MSQLATVDGSNASNAVEWLYFPGDTRADIATRNGLARGFAPLRIVIASAATEAEMVCFVLQPCQSPDVGGLG
jgi:hypothetical protein